MDPHHESIRPAPVDNTAPRDRTAEVGRRQMITWGGGAVAASAVFAACGTGSGSTKASKAPPASRSGAPSSATSADMDVTVLRTASSLEVLAVQTYQGVIGMELITDGVTVAAAQTFMDHHGQHADELEAVTTKAGGRPFTQPNSVFDAQVIAPAVALLKTQTDALMLAYMLESVISQTYQIAVGALSQSAYRATAASVLGVECRHQALLGLILTDTVVPPYPANGFQSSANAVKAGVGL